MGELRCLNCGQSFLQSHFQRKFINDSSKISVSTFEHMAYEGYIRTEKLFIRRYIVRSCIPSAIQFCIMSVLLVIFLLIGMRYYTTEDPALKTTLSMEQTTWPVLEQTTLAVSVETNQTTIYIVTATYRRPEQHAELTRLAQTLMLVPHIHWVLVEHSAKKSPLISNLLEKWGIPTTHLNTDWSPLPLSQRWRLKGANCKNVALKWIRENVTDGVLYFADDDNSYDKDLFREMRNTKKVSMWPVGLVTKLGFSSPIVKDGKLIGFYDGFMAGRKFPVDMAGFAVNINFLKQRPKAEMCYNIGYHEDSFLRTLEPFEPEEIELKADNCTKVLVWHTQSKKWNPAPPVDKEKYANTNLINLKRIVV